MTLDICVMEDSNRKCLARDPYARPVGVPNSKSVLCACRNSIRCSQTASATHPSPLVSSRFTKAQRSWAPLLYVWHSQKFTSLTFGFHRQRTSSLSAYLLPPLTMSAADAKPKKLRKSKGAFGKDGVDPRTAASVQAAEEVKQDKKRKAENEDETPAAAAAGEEADDDEAKKEKKRLKKEKKAAKAALAASAAEVSAPLTKEEVAVAPAAAAAVEEVSASDKKSKKDKKKAKKTTFGSPPPTSTPVAAAPVASTSKAAVIIKDINAEGKAFLETHKVTVSHPYQPLLDFASLPISSKLSPAFKDFKVPSPIQACSWPALFDGKDVVGIAETGSGKTLGFGVRLSIPNQLLLAMLT